VISLSAIDRAELTVLLDLRHPLSYLALRPAIEFGAAMSIEINWLPLTVPPLRPPTAVGPDDDRGVRHRRHRAHAIAREIAVYAQQQGLVIRDYYRHDRNDDVDAANLGWLWLRERYPDRLQAYLQELFRGYWSGQLDASRIEPVGELLHSLDADQQSFAKWCVEAGPSMAARLAAELHEKGLFQVPSFVVKDEVFIGRQHLPMIRWILQGRSGPIPI